MCVFDCARETAIISLTKRYFTGGAEDVRVRYGGAEGPPRKHDGGPGPRLVIADVWLPCGAEGTHCNTVLRVDLKLTRNTFQAIEYVSPEQQAMFVQELSPSVLRCVKDANGNHVGALGRYSVLRSDADGRRRKSSKRSLSTWCRTALGS